MTALAELYRDAYSSGFSYGEHDASANAAMVHEYKLVFEEEARAAVEAKVLGPQHRALAATALGIARGYRHGVLAEYARD